MWFKSPKPSTIKYPIHPTGVAVLATTHTTVTYTTVGAEGLELYGINQQNVRTPGNEDVVPYSSILSAQANACSIQQCSNVGKNQNENHIGCSLNIPTHPADNGFGFFSSAPNLRQIPTTSNAPVVQIKVLRRPSLIRRLLSLGDFFHRRYSNKDLAPTFSPQEVDELAARFVHQRSGDVGRVSLDPSLLPHFSGISIQNPVTEGLTRPIDSFTIADDDNEIVHHVTLSEYHNDPRYELTDAEESFLPWQEEMMLSDARKREASLLERAMEVQAIEERVRQEESQARQWVKSMNAPEQKRSKLRACRKLAKKSMKKLFRSK